MVSQTVKRSATSLRLLCEAAKSYGVELEQCLAGTDINPDQLTDPEFQIFTWQEIHAIQNISRVADTTTGLGVSVGKDFNVHAFGIWGFAILTSPTIRSAIKTAIEFDKISFLLADAELIEDDSSAKIAFDISDLPSSTRSYVIERHSFIAMKFIKEILQEPDLQGFVIELTETDEEYAANLAKLMDVTVKSGMHQNALVFSPDLLDKTLPKSDPATLVFCLNQCKALAEKIQNVLPPISQQVRDELIKNIDREQHIEEIAQGFAMSERTLRRRLSDEGTNFRDIYTDCRMAIAYELLEQTGLNVETVSWRVGYAEPASFAHAFSKKFGISASELRKSTKSQLA